MAICGWGNNLNKILTAIKKIFESFVIKKDERLAVEMYIKNSRIRTGLAKVFREHLHKTIVEFEKMESGKEYNIDYDYSFPTIWHLKAKGIGFTNINYLYDLGIVPNIQHFDELSGENYSEWGDYIKDKFWDPKRPCSGAAVFNYRDFMNNIITLRCRRDTLLWGEKHALGEVYYEHIPKKDYVDVIRSHDEANFSMDIDELGYYGLNFGAPYCDYRGIDQSFNNLLEPKECYIFEGENDAMRLAQEYINKRNHDLEAKSIICTGGSSTKNLEPLAQIGYSHFYGFVKQKREKNFRFFMQLFLI